MFGNGLAEVVRIAHDIVDDKIQMVCCDAGSDGRAAGFHGLNGGSSGAVLEDDAKGREVGVELKEGREESFFGVQDRYVGAFGAGKLAVKVEDEVLTLHFGEDGIEDGVVNHAGGGVGGYTWSALD
jgi:hypothetical protein